LAAADTMPAVNAPDSVFNDYPLAIQGLLGGQSYTNPDVDALSRLSFDTAPPQPDLYVARKGDTLSGIAGGNYARMAAIAKANNLELTANGSPLIRNGQLLLMPNLSGTDPAAQRHLDISGRNIVAANTRTMAQQRAPRNRYSSILDPGGPLLRGLLNNWNASGEPTRPPVRLDSLLGENASLPVFSGNPWFKQLRQVNNDSPRTYTDPYGQKYVLQDDSSGSRMVPDNRERDLTLQRYNEVGKTEGYSSDGQPGMGSFQSILYSYAKHIFDAPDNIANGLGSLGGLADNLGAASLEGTAYGPSSVARVEESEWTPPSGWRMPASNGKWTGTPGDSDWISYNDSVNAITGNRPVPFKRGLPELGRWAKESYKLDDLTGQPSDAKKVDGAIARKYGLTSRKAVKDWLTAQRLSRHHAHDGATMELVPSDLHDKIPHFGGASGLRYGGWDE